MKNNTLPLNKYNLVYTEHLDNFVKMYIELKVNIISKYIYYFN